jgi:branched-chain amino acid transport system permease protein
MKTRLAILILVILLALLPVYAGKYAVYVVIHILLLSIFSLGFNLLFGYTGLLSFGQAGFYAVGAYGCAKILLVYPSLLVGIVGGVAITGAVSLALGYLCIRHTRIYFSMLTLSFGMMIFSLAWKWRDMTGGDDGLVGIPRAPLEIPGLFKVNMVPMENYYYVVLAFAILAIALFHRIVHSPMGLTLQGIRDSETRTACIGISCFPPWKAR